MWDGSVWSAIGTFGGFSQPIIQGLVVHNGTLYAGGGNTLPLQWTGSNWLTLNPSVPPNPMSPVLELGTHGGSLVASCRFNIPGDQTFQHVAKWNSPNWNVLGDEFAGGTVWYNEGVHALSEFGGALIAAGDFTTVGGVSAHNIAQWDGAGWDPVHLSVPPPSVWAIENFGSQLAIGGDFIEPTAASVLTNNVVRWDGANLWPMGSGMNATVTSLKSFTYPGPLGAKELVAGGLFTIAGGIPSNFIARWDEDPIIGFPPPAWQSMGAGFNSGVYAIERFLNQTIAAGAFTASGGTTVNHIAKWNETTDVWEPMGTGVNGSVRALKGVDFGIGGNALYAGGDFTTAGGVSANHIALWTSGNPTWQPVGAGLNGSVHAIEYANFTLYAAGDFTASGGTGLGRVAFYAPFGGGWLPLGNGIGFNGTVKALKAVGNLLYAAGQFTSIDGVAANHVAVWNGTSWAGVHGGVNDWALALGLYQNEIHVGGLFNAASFGSVTSPGWTIYQETGAPWIASQPQSATIECGQNFTSQVQVADGYDPLQYQWRRDGTNIADGPTGTGSTISGATSATLGVTNASSADAGDYDVVVTNECGSVTSLPATLTVSCLLGPDLNGDGAVNTADLLIVINAWGVCPPPPAPCPADLNGDGLVNVGDLLIVINNWGP